jgi:hypothetical protein
MTSKAFSKGDRVKVTDSPGFHLVKYGDVGIVTGVETRNGDEMIEIQFFDYPHNPIMTMYAYHFDKCNCEVCDERFRCLTTYNF